MNEDTAGHPVEVLSFEGGKSLGKPSALLVLRPHPDNGFEEPVSFLFSQEQCVRLRDSLNSFLQKKSSWLYLSPEKQKLLRKGIE